MKRLTGILIMLTFSLFLSGASGVDPLVIVPSVFALSVINSFASVPIGALLDITATSAFIGTNRSQFIIDLVFGAQTMQKGLIHMIPNKHSTIYLPIVKTDADQLQDRQEEPDASATTEYSEKSITPKDMQWFQKFNPEKFEHVWSEFWPGGRLARQIMNPKVMSVVIQTIAASLNNQLDRNFWQGDETLGAADPLRFFDGYITQFNKPGSLVVNTAFNTGITKSNVVSELEKLLEAAKPEVKAQGAAKIITSYDVVEKYEAAARSMDFKGTNITDAIAHRFGGFTMVPVGGMPLDTIVFAESDTSVNSNLLAGTWLPNEKDNLIIDRFRPESELWFILTKFRMGTQYAKGEEIAINQRDPA